jgi:hypothetical protein
MTAMLELDLVKRFLIESLISGPNRPSVPGAALSAHASSIIQAEFKARNWMPVSSNSVDRLCAPGFNEYSSCLNWWWNRAKFLKRVG